MRIIEIRGLDMRKYHWSINCAVIYLILIFIINIGFSTWSTIEHSRLTTNFDNSDSTTTISKGFKSLIGSLQDSLDNTDNTLHEVQIEAKLLAKTALSTLIYLYLSFFASIFTTVALLIPKIAMETLEKFVEMPDIDYDSIGKFKLIMVLANISLFLWDIKGIVDTSKYFI